MPTSARGAPKHLQKSDIASLRAGGADVIGFAQLQIARVYDDRPIPGLAEHANTLSAAAHSCPELDGVLLRRAPVNAKNGLQPVWHSLCSAAPHARPQSRYPRPGPAA